MRFQEEIPGFFVSGCVNSSFSSEIKGVMKMAENVAINYADGYKQLDLRNPESATIGEEGFDDVPYIGVKPPTKTQQQVEETKRMLEGN